MNVTVVNDPLLLTEEQKAQVAAFADMRFSLKDYDAGLTEGMDIGIELIGGVFSHELEGQDVVLDSLQAAYKISGNGLYLIRHGEYPPVKFERVGERMFLHRYVRNVNGEARISMLEVKEKLPLESKVVMSLPFEVYSVLLGEQGMAALSRALYEHAAMFMNDGKIILNLTYEGSVPAGTISEEKGEPPEVEGKSAWHYDKDGDLVEQERLTGGALAVLKYFPLDTSGLYFALKVMADEYVPDELFVRVVKVVD